MRRIIDLLVELSILGITLYAVYKGLQVVASIGFITFILTAILELDKLNKDSK